MHTQLLDLFVVVDMMALLNCNNNQLFTLWSGATVMLIPKVVYCWIFMYVYGCILVIMLWRLNLKSSHCTSGKLLWSISLRMLPLKCGICGSQVQLQSLKVFKPLYVYASKMLLWCIMFMVFTCIALPLVWINLVQ